MFIFSEKNVLRRKQLIKKKYLCASKFIAKTKCFLNFESGPGTVLAWLLDWLLLKSGGYFIDIQFFDVVVQHYPSYKSKHHEIKKGSFDLKLYS